MASSRLGLDIGVIILGLLAEGPSNGLGAGLHVRRHGQEVFLDRAIRFGRRVVNHDDGDGFFQALALELKQLGLGLLVVMDEFEFTLFQHTIIAINFQASITNFGVRMTEDLFDRELFGIRGILAGDQNATEIMNPCSPNIAILAVTATFDIVSKHGGRNVRRASFAVEFAVHVQLPLNWAERLVPTKLLKIIQPLRTFVQRHFVTIPFFDLVTKDYGGQLPASSLAWILYSKYTLL